MAKSKDNGEGKQIEREFVEELADYFKKSDSQASAGFLWESSSNVTNWISTGSLLLDLAISNVKDGGVPVGRLTEISGGEGAGKSLLAAYILANTQKKGGVGVLIDTEHATSKEVLKAVGVDMNKLVYVQAGSIEDVFRAMDAITNKIASDPEKGKRLITIVWDSVAATSTYAEVEGNYGDHTIGMAARLIGQGLRKFIPIVSTHNICLVFINQLRMKIGAMGYGDPYDTPGGKAIPFHASVRIRLQHYSQLKDSATKIQLGRVVKAEIKKNKVAPPMRTQFFTIKWGTKPGAWLDEASSILDACEAAGIVKKLTAQSYEISVPGSSSPKKFTKKSWEDMLNDPNIYSFVKDKLEDRLIITEKNVTADEIESTLSAEDEGV